MTEERAKRKLSGILSADAVGYSRLMQEDETSTIRTLEDIKSLMSELIEQFKGRVVDAPGDNLLAEFGSVVDATECAVKIQQELKTKNAELYDNRKMHFRIGVNLGDVVEEAGRIYGDGVNIAARIEGLAEPGEVCISGAVYDQVENRLSLKFEYLGEQKVKNIAKPIRVYRIKMKTELKIPVLSNDIKLPDKPSIAVLPFVNMTDDPDQENFSDGISEDIITDLSKLSGLLVIARNSSFIYKGRYADIRQVGRELGVRYVLEGSVRKSGNRMRITAQLIDALSGHHLWANRYDRELKDIFVIQDEITEKIVIDLDVKLVGGEQSRVYRKSLKNHKAREIYYHGLSNVHRLTKESVAEARRSFKKVIELEPDSPLGYAWAGATHFFDAYNGWSKSFVLSLQSATELAQKAIALDDNTADAHTLLGFIYVLTRQFDKAISEAERALALCPNGADIVQSVAGIFMFAGKPKKAVALTKQAMRLNPIPPPVYFNFLGISYREIKEYEAAIATLKEGIARYPEYILSRFALVTTYCAAGQYDEAQVEARELLRIDPRFNMEQYTMMLPYKDKSVIERLLADLREAGLLSTDLEP